MTIHTGALAHITPSMLRKYSTFAALIMCLSSSFCMTAQELAPGDNCLILQEREGLQRIYLDISNIEHIDIVESAAIVHGDGTREHPHNVDFSIYCGEDNQTDNRHWFQAFIVGWVEGANRYRDNIRFDIPPEGTQIDDNRFLLNCVVVADNPNETDPNKCMIIYAPNANLGPESGGPNPALINLIDHPENLGKMVTFTAVTRTSKSTDVLMSYYFSVDNLTIEDAPERVELCAEITTKEPARVIPVRLESLEGMPHLKLGAGTVDNPFTVYQIVANPTINGEIAVSGYIVGYLTTAGFKVENYGIGIADDPETMRNNYLLIADLTDERNTLYCYPINIPNDLIDTYNLRTHHDLIGRRLTAIGTPYTSTDTDGNIASIRLRSVTTLILH